MRYLTDESADQIAVVNIQLASACGRITLRHVLLDDLIRSCALHEHRAKVADQRRKNVSFLPVERICAADCVCFLSERPEQSTDDLCLPVEIDESLLERSSQPHV